MNLGETQKESFTFYPKKKYIYIYIQYLKSLFKASAGTKKLWILRFNDLSQGGLNLDK